VGLVLEEDRAAAFNDQAYAGGEWIDRRDSTTGVLEKVFVGGEEVGQVTYSNRGHSVGKMLAMAYVKTSLSWPGNRLTVNVGGRPCPAVITQTPFYDPQGVRLRA